MEIKKIGRDHVVFKQGQAVAKGRTRGLALRAFTEFQLNNKDKKDDKQTSKF